MPKKLISVGKEKALVLDKGLLEALQINEDTPFEMTYLEHEDKVSLVLTPVAKQKKLKKQTTISKDSKKQKAYEEIVEIYKPALKKLSESLL